jgi:hypothetical protein
LSLLFYQQETSPRAGFLLIKLFFDIRASRRKMAGNLAGEQQSGYGDGMI